MNIGNITSNNFNLDSNGKDMQIDIYEQLIEQLQQENKILKENYERIYNENCILREKHNINDIDLLDENTKLKEVVDKLENQQKEFIEYMNKTIEELECDDFDDEEMNCYFIQRIDTFKEIFSKYKEITGDMLGDDK